MRKPTIENECAKYTDIFYISYSLKTTDIHTRTVTLKPNMISIFTKPYRLPYAQKSEVKTLRS